MSNVIAGSVEEIAVLNPAGRFIPYFFCILCALFLLAAAPPTQAQIVINPTTLPNGAVGSTYAQLIAAGGGTSPISFKVSSGTLPTGLKLGSPANSLFATIGGVPTGASGASTFTLQATDSSVPPQTTSVTYTLTITAADTTNDAELKGTYAFLFQGFNDHDSTMEMVAASFNADGQGNISVGFEDALGSGGVQPTQAVTGKYWLGADNRGTMELTTQSGSVLVAFSAGNIVNGVATKARLIRFDDVDGTTGHVGSGVMFKQDPSKFALNGLNGSYAFGEVGSLLIPGIPQNGNPQSAIGLAIFDGQGNFVNGSTVDINNAGNLQTSSAISGTYALSNETVSNGRLTLSPVIEGNNGTVSDVVYIIDATQFIFLSIDTTSQVIYSGLAELQTTPENFSLASLAGNSVMAIQGKQTNGISTATIGSLSSPGNGTFTFDYVQQNTGSATPQTTGTANGTIAITPNGRAVLTFPNGPFSPVILYLSGANQGIAAETDTAASTGPLDPGGNNFSNATLSGSANFFGGSFNPPTPQDSNSITVITFGATSYSPTTDGSAAGGVLGADLTSTNFNYSVAADGQLTVPQSGGVVGYVSSACKLEVLLSSPAGPTLGTTECQGVSTPANETLTVTVTGSGHVTSLPAGIDCPTACSAPYPTGTQVLLTATAGPSATFTSFSTNCVPANPQTNPPTCTVTMNSAQAVTATFSTNTFPLTVTKAGTGTGTVTSSPAGINCGATCSANFDSGTQVTLTATPATGSTFTGWGAPCSGTGTCVVTTTIAISVTATFTASANNFTLTVTKAGTGTGTVTSAPAGINCGATCAGSFASGTQITLTAAPATGSTFTGWGAPCSGTGTCVVTLTAATTVTATFTPTANNFTLTVTKAGNGTGTVTSAPAGINCGATCAGSFASGTQITLTAAPAAGSTFTGWSAPCQGTGSCLVTLTAATTVTATFTQSTTNFALTVTETGTGTGTVTSSPAGIACQPTCTANFASGQVVALTATPAQGSTFAGWSGAGCSGTAGCSVTMTAAQTVTATFNKSTSNFTLTVAEAGSGTGTVTSSPAGISCQPTCSASFASGQVVALTATPADGSTFAGWSGAGCSGTAGCSVTMNATEALTATFNSNNSPVTISVAPGTPGTASTAPGGGAVFGLLLTSTPGTTGNVTLGCASPSPNITCQIVPNSITLTGKGTNVAIVVNTFCTAAAPVPAPGEFPRGTPGGLGVLLATLCLAMCGAMWQFKSRRSWSLAAVSLIVIATIGMSACASLPKSPGGQATPPGNYPLVVTATAPNGSTSSVNLTLTVLP